MTKDQLENLMKAHQMELYRYVQFLGADPAVAEDIVQETFVVAYYHKNLPDLENLSLRTSWLRSVARNTFYKYCRKEKRVFNMSDNQSLLVDQYWENVNENDGLFLRKEALDSCLEELPEKQSEALTMRYKQRLSREQMAEQMAMSENGIKSLLQRLRKALAKCIKLKLQEDMS